MGKNGSSFQSKISNLIQVNFAGFHEIQKLFWDRFDKPSSDQPRA